MMRMVRGFSLVLALGLSPAGRPMAAEPAPAEWWVDQAAPAAAADGSAAAPFRTISEATGKLRGGDTITVRAGVYSETVTVSVSGTPERPTTLRAAPGQRVVLSGFVPVSGWQPYRDAGIYTTTVDGPVGDLFVGTQPQRLSRWPDATRPWRLLRDVDARAGTLHDAQGLSGEAVLATVAQAPAAARLFLYFRSGNAFTDADLARLDLVTSTLTAGETRPLGLLRGDGDRYQIVNHVGLIRAPGEWAFEPADGKQTRLLFRPADPLDLQRTQVRRAGQQRLLYIGHWQKPVAHVGVEGFEVAGSDGMGVQVTNTENVTVAGCLIHHNSGAGISVRRSAFAEVTGNLVLANGSGVVVASSHDVLIQHNEIAFSTIDGINVAGNVSGRPDGEPTTRDVRVRRNYIHHHLLLSHPDNLQTYRGVENLTLEEDLLLWGGQALMTEETNHGTVRNCVLVGTAAYAVIFGHGNASDWTVAGCTIGLGGWGGISMTGTQYQLHDNILFQNALELGATTTSDFNLYAPAADSQPVCLTGKPKWQRFLQPADAAAVTGQEVHSRRDDPQFRSAPTRQAVALWDDRNTLDRLFVRQAGVQPPTDGFAVGDGLEINGDGRLRRISAVDADSVAFAPALPALPLREALLWNWGRATACALDLRPAEGSPARVAGRDGRSAGSGLDIGAFQRGDFDGDGRRDLPPVPPDVQAAWPDPNHPVLTAHGS